jgi:hypothetical protein
VLLTPMLSIMSLQIGYTTIMLLVEVLIADTTTLRNRVLFSFIPALPFLVFIDRLYS